MTPTHYKVVPLNEKPDDPSQLSIPIVSEAGMVTQAFLFDLKMYDPNKWKQLKPVEGILVTEEEIEELKRKAVIEYVEQKRKRINSETPSRPQKPSRGETNWY
jgi:nitrogen regulatory protein PII-like uncharacterized protein